MQGHCSVLRDDPVQFEQEAHVQHLVGHGVKEGTVLPLTLQQLFDANLEALNVGVLPDFNALTHPLPDQVGKIYRRGEVLIRMPADHAGPPPKHVHSNLREYLSAGGIKAPDPMSTKQEIHNLEHFGPLQICEVHHPVSKTGRHLRAFPMLHKLCAQTPCNLKDYPVDQYLSPEEKALLDQTGGMLPLCMSKSVDGLLFNKGDRLVAGMYGKSLYQPKSKDPNKVIVNVDSGGSTNQQVFKLCMHNDLCDAHEISRHAITQHILSQMLAVKPPVLGDATPRILFESPNLGTFSSRVLVGPAVHSLKLSFLDMIAKMNKKGTGIYDKTIKLNPEFSKMLMLKDSYGNIKCNHCAGGIIGYRTNQFTKKNTFVFMANSNDFYDSKPADKDQSMLQLMKMDYADTSKNGPRIVVVKNDDDDDDDDDESSSNDDDDDDEDNDGGDAEDHCVHLNNTVQQNLNQIERAFRQFLLKYYGCELFPHYCSMLDKSQSKPSLLGNGTSNLRIKGG